MQINKRSAKGHELSLMEIGGCVAKFHAFSIWALYVILCLICLSSTVNAVDYYAGETYTFSTPSYPGYLYLWSAENEQGHPAGSSSDYSNDTFVWTAPLEPQKVIISVIVASSWLESCKGYAEMPINISPLSSIIVVKNAIPKDAQAFQFTGSPDIGPFTLYDDGISNPDSTSNSQTFDRLLPGTYSIEETVPASWMLTRAVCSDGSLVDKIDLAPGESVTATFTDTELGRIDITKVVNWNGVTPDPSQTFEICLRGPSYPLGTEDGACKTIGSEGGDLAWSDLIPGEYTVTETPLVGWTTTITGSPATVTSGRTAECAVSNVKYPLGGKFQISGLKFNDLNGNGIKDANEPGLKGWMIRLKHEGSQYNQSMLTEDDGSYLFTGLAGSWDLCSMGRPKLESRMDSNHACRWLDLRSPHGRQANCDVELWKYAATSGRHKGGRSNLRICWIYYHLHTHCDQ